MTTAVSGTAFRPKTKALLAPHPVGRAGRDSDIEAFKILGEDDLAGEPRRPSRVRREVEQVLFLLGRRR